MRLWGALSLVALIVFLPIGRADATLLRNQPPVVEQQTGTGCALDFDLSDCVTNAGPCVWDADDALWTYMGTDRLQPGASISISACAFSDWVEHFIGMKAYGRAKGQPQPYRLTITVNGASVERSTTTHDGVTLCTATTEYDRGANLPEVSYQGGGGGVLGRAVPTAITFSLTNTGPRAIRGLAAILEVSWGDNIIGCPYD